MKRGYVWREKTYISSIVMYLAYIMSYWHPLRPSTITCVIKRTEFVYLLRSNQYVSNIYILDQNPRLSPYKIGGTYSDYMSLLLVCGDCSLTSKIGGCWNLVESTQAKNSLYHVESQSIEEICTNIFNYDHPKIVILVSGYCTMLESVGINSS